MRGRERSGADGEDLCPSRTRQKLRNYSCWRSQLVGWSDNKIGRIFVARFRAHFRPVDKQCRPLELETLNQSIKNLPFGFESQVSRCSSCQKSYLIPPPRESPVATPSRPQSITRSLHNAQKSLSTKIHFPPLNRVGEISALRDFTFASPPAAESFDST